MREFGFLFWAKHMAFGQGVVVKGGLLVLSCDALLGNCDNCYHTPSSLSQQPRFPISCNSSKRFSREQYHACAAEPPVCPGNQKYLSRI